MVISPNDFSLWARLTGNKYPSTPAERAKKGPEVQNFIQNLGKEGMLGGKKPEQPKKEKTLGEKVATGALIAGGVAAAVAAGRDPNINNFVKRTGSTAKDKVGDFLRNIAGPRVIDRDIVDASYDVTPNPREQQSNIGSQVSKFLLDVPVSPTEVVNGANTVKTTNRSKDPSSTAEYILSKDAPPSRLYTEVNVEPVDKFTPVVQGKTYFTEGSISKEDPYGDISNLEQRVDRTYKNYLKNFEGSLGEKLKKRLLSEAAQGREFDIGYINAMARGRTDEQATLTGRKFGGFDNETTGLDRSVEAQTPYRKALSELKIASTVPAKIDDLLKLVETGPQK
jgi:hypothetical protein